MSISSTSFNPYANASDLRSAATSRQHARAADDDSHAGRRPDHAEGVRPQRLERALMAALQGLGLGADAAAATTTATKAGASAAIDTGLPAPTSPVSDSSSKTDAAATLKEAVHAFAHELAQALRGGDDGDRSTRGHGHGAGDYGGLSQKLENLSEKLAGADDATPVQPIKVAPTDAPTADVPIIYVAAPAEADTKDAPIKADSTPAQSTPVDNTPILVTPESEATTPAASATTNVATTTTPAATAKTDKLLDAFTELFDKLKANSGTADSGTSVDYAAKLKEFLHSLAQSFSPREAMPISTPGGLLNLTA